MDKKSFILYMDQAELFDQLPDDVAGKLIKHIFNYVNGGADKSGELIVDVAFAAIKQAINRDTKKWDAIAKRNRVNGSKGGRPSGKKEPKEPTGLSGNPDEPKEPVSVSASASAIKEKDKKKKAVAFVRPSENDLQNYAMEAKLNIDGMYDFYQSNGWKVGRNAMKDWKATARNWSRRNGTGKQGSGPRGSGARMHERLKSVAESGTVASLLDN